MFATRVTQTAQASGIAAGLIWGTGDNSMGELGLGDQVNLTGASTLHQTRPIIDRPTAVAAGLHSLALDAAGSVWAWGPNQHGELGLGPGTLGSHFGPSKVVGLHDVIAIAAGNGHSLALRVDGTVWAWGANSEGQLGDGTITDRLAPVRVALLKNAIAISAGSGFSLALASNGTVWAWGNNVYGQLGDGTKVGRHRAVVVNGLVNVAVISACSLGYHSLALKADGTVWSWGLNNYGQLGLGSTLDYAVPKQVSSVSYAIGIAAGGWHSLALTVNGVVYASGRNDSGQLGDGTTNDRHVFDSVTVPEGDDPNPNIPLAKVVEVAAGNAHSLARLVDGSVRAWGFGNAGRLGTGSDADHHQPASVRESPDAADHPSRAGQAATHMTAIAAGGMHSLMIRDELIVKDESGNFDLWTSSTAWAWGSGATGQLLGSVVPYSAYAVTWDWKWGVDWTNLPATAIAASERNSASTEVGRTIVWGQTGVGTGSFDPFEPAALVTGFPADVAAIAAGPTQLVVITAQGTSWEWVYQPAAGPVIGPHGNASGTAVAVGGRHSLILSADGTVLAWGKNNRGQLGWGSVGADDYYYPNANPVELLEDVVAIAAGFAHSVALRADGTVWAWGANDLGQLGDTTTNDRAYPALVVRDSFGHPLHAKAIAAYGGSHHSLALAPDGTVWAWGWNERGQLGDGSTTNRTQAVRVRWHSAVRRAPLLDAVKAVAAGWQHSLALLADGRAFGWGLNNLGQLGEGTTNDRHRPNAGDPVQSITPPLDEAGLQRMLVLDAVTALAAGDRHSLALGRQPNA